MPTLAENAVVASLFVDRDEQVAGRGKRLFDEGGPPRYIKLATVPHVSFALLPELAKIHWRLGCEVISMGWLAFAPFDRSRFASSSCWS